MPTCAISDLIDFNPSTSVPRTELTPFVDMAALSTSGRAIAHIGQRPYSSSGSKFRNGDTLLARITPCLENGKGAQVSGIQGSGVGQGSTEFIVLRAKQPTDASFVYYLSRDPEFRTFAIQQMSGTSGRQRVSWQSLADFQIERLDTMTRQAIGAILCALDDKIELNRRINETLAASARALFRDWFADFGPTRAKAEGRPAYLAPDLWSLFPDQVKDDGTPDGWNLVSFGDLLLGSIGGDWGSDNPTELNTQRVSIIRGTDIPALVDGGVGKIPSRYTTPKKLASRQLQADDIVIEVSGGSPTQPTGRSALISQSMLDRFVDPVVCASFCRRFRPRHPRAAILAAMHLEDLFARGGTWEYQNQSTGIANFQTTHFLEHEQVVMPSSNVASAFLEMIAPLREMMNRNENVTLAETRDTLLPKLMSGAIRVRDAESAVAALC